MTVRRFLTTACCILLAYGCRPVALHPSGDDDVCVAAVVVTRKAVETGIDEPGTLTLIECHGGQRLTVTVPVSHRTVKWVFDWRHGQLVRFTEEDSWHAYSHELGSILRDRVTSTVTRQTMLSHGAIASFTQDGDPSVLPQRSAADILGMAEYLGKLADAEADTVVFEEDFLDGRELSE